MISNILHLWAGPLPPEEHHPNPLFHWLFHPLKRHLARNYLKIMQRFFSLQVIAIGGSNGKTTTRNMLLSILPNAVATLDSITSTYNIPTSILKLRPSTKYFICEMSVEYIGDMDFYLWLVKPDLAIITQIELEHTQFFGSLDIVAREENKLTRGKWTKIINGNSPLINSNGINTFTFGTSEKFDCFIESIHHTKNLNLEISLKIKNEKLKINLPGIGTHLAHPLAATILTAHKLNIIPKNMSSFKSAPHRLNIINHQSGAIFIDDTYNSNPSSAKAAIETAIDLAKITHREPIFVLSQMNELGPYEISEHQKLDTLIKNQKLKIKNLNAFSIGPAAKNIGQNFETIEELLDKLKSLALSTKHLVLFKSSRSWQLEKLISQL